MQNLTFTTLWANSADDELIIFLFFLPENWLWYFMQIGDNLHVISRPIFCEKKKKKKKKKKNKIKKKIRKYFRMSSAEIFTRHAYR